jgi:hypothetical protein
MRNRINIDEMLSRAIIREIGERLQARLHEGEELSDTLKRQMERIRELDDEPSMVADSNEKIGKPKVGRRLLSPTQWVTRWRTRRRRTRA